MARLALSCLAVVLAAGCAVAPLPPVDLDAAGWETRRGQAVWHPPGDRPSIVGELRYALRREGDVWIELAKPPFSIFAARAAGSRWEIKLFDRKRPYRGRGEPPRRFVWLHVPGWIEGGELPPGWRGEHLGDGVHRVERADGRESMRIVIEP